MFMPKSTKISICPLSSATFVQANTPDQAARANITVQAGANTQFGGVHGGLRKCPYQVPTVVVKLPTARTRITATLAITMGMTN
jgi:hypothetical protein